MPPSKRSLRHLKVSCKSAIFFPAIMAVGWLCGSLLQGAAQLGFDGRMFPSALALAGGIALAMLCVVLAHEFGALYERWQDEQEEDDTAFPKARRTA